MTAVAPQRTRSLTIIAQDPSIRKNGKVLRTCVDVRAEDLNRGPWGHRVQVIDYDASTGTLYRPLDPARYNGKVGQCLDPYLDVPDARLLSDPRFHAQNVYAIVMHTLWRFEHALGRRVAWGFGTHQLKVAPHAFADANAFYSADDEALVFGYFPARDGGMVYSALSHDVVAHETTHALLDGIRHRFLDPSSPDQAAFHEGYADVVALLSVFALRDIAGVLIDYVGDGATASRRSSPGRASLIRHSAVTEGALKKAMLFGLAEQMGEEMSGVRGQPLRHSLQLEPSPDYYNDRKAHPEYDEPHQRGEILVAAMLDAFIHVWVARLGALGYIRPGYHDRDRVIEEGAAAADYLLTMAIRALDYMPPTHILYGDFLSALVTADLELRPDDSKYGFRRRLIDAFSRFGIRPASRGTAAEPGVWARPGGELTYARSRFESMLRDPEEVFGFIWENRKQLHIYDGAYGQVLSVRPCLRIGPDDGFPLHETVAEFYQVLRLTGSELRTLGLKKPEGMADEQVVPLYGGNALIFDEYGRLKYNIYNRINDADRQQRRLNYLWSRGFFDPGARAFNQISALHARRAMGESLEPRKENW